MSLCNNKIKKISFSINKFFYNESQLLTDDY